VHRGLPRGLPRAAIIALTGYVTPSLDRAVGRVFAACMNSVRAVRLEVTMRGATVTVALRAVGSGRVVYRVSRRTERTTEVAVLGAERYCVAQGLVLVMPPANDGAVAAEDVA
jgi:hypothetical protein